MTYRARDLFLVPGILTLARIPLAVLFPFVASRPFAALAVLLAAGVTDVLDGYLARRLGQATPTGAAADPVTDKLFVASVLVTLLARGRLSPVDLVLLSTREIGELPLVIWFLVSHATRKARAEQPLANLPGKAATFCQFVTVAVALFGTRFLRELLVMTAVVGVIAAVTYWVREIRRAQATMPT